LQNSSSPSQVSSLATIERKYVLGEKSQNGSNNYEDSSFSDEEDSCITENVSGNKKRKKYGPYHKRQKRSSVESHTVSVTWSNSSIFSNCSDETRSLKENGSDCADRNDIFKSRYEKRSLRVSLSLPEDVEKKLSLKSPLLSNGIQEDPTSPTTSVVKVSPMEEKQEDCEAFKASSLPVVTSGDQAESGPSSSSEIALPFMETENSIEAPCDMDGVSESAMISSCKSPPAEVPADSSTAEKCSPSTGNVNVQITRSSSEETDALSEEICEDYESASGREKVICNSSMEEKETATPAVLAASEVAAAALIPTTLPVIIGRSKYLANTTEVMSPTKATASSGDCACEAGDSSCAQLTPISTSSGVFKIISNNNNMDRNGTNPEPAGEDLTSPASLVDEKDSSETAKEDRHVGSPVAVSEALTGTSIVSPAKPAPAPSASTPVITDGAVSTLKPQRQPIDPAVDGMSQLDKQLAAVIGYGEDDQVKLNHTSSDRNMDVVVTTKYKTTDSVCSTKNLKNSEPCKSNERSVANATEVREEKPPDENDVNVPDVIITSVEPSKENSTRRDSNAVRPSSLTVSWLEIVASV